MATKLAVTQSLSFKIGKSEELNLHTFAPEKLIQYEELMAALITELDQERGHRSLGSTAPFFEKYKNQPKLDRGGFHWSVGDLSLLEIRFGTRTKENFYLSDEHIQHALAAIFYNAFLMASQVAKIADKGIQTSYVEKCRNLNTYIVGDIKKDLGGGNGQTSADKLALILIGAYNKSSKFIEEMVTTPQLPARQEAVAGTVRNDPRLQYDDQLVNKFIGYIEDFHNDHVPNGISFMERNLGTSSYYYQDLVKQKIQLNKIYSAIIHNIKNTEWYRSNQSKTKDTLNQEINDFAMKFAKACFAETITTIDYSILKDLTITDKEGLGKALDGVLTRGSPALQRVVAREGDLLDENGGGGIFGGLVKGIRHGSGERSFTRISKEKIDPAISFLEQRLHFLKGTSPGYSAKTLEIVTGAKFDALAVDLEKVPSAKKTKKLLFIAKNEQHRCIHSDSEADYVYVNQRLTADKNKKDINESTKTQVGVYQSRVRKNYIDDSKKNLGYWVKSKALDPKSGKLKKVCVYALDNLDVTNYRQIAEKIQKASKRQRVVIDLSAIKTIKNVKSLEHLITAITTIARNKKSIEIQFADEIDFSGQDKEELRTALYAATRGATCDLTLNVKKWNGYAERNIKIKQRDDHGAVYSYQGNLQNRQLLVTYDECHKSIRDQYNVLYGRQNGSLSPLACQAAIKKCLLNEGKKFDFSKIPPGDLKSVLSYLSGVSIVYFPLVEELILPRALPGYEESEIITNSHPCLRPFQHIKTLHVSPRITKVGQYKNNFDLTGLSELQQVVIEEDLFDQCIGKEKSISFNFKVKEEAIVSNFTRSKNTHVYRTNSISNKCQKITSSAPVLTEDQEKLYNGINDAVFKIIETQPEYTQAHALRLVMSLLYITSAFLYVGFLPTDLKIPGAPERLLKHLFDGLQPDVKKILDSVVGLVNISKGLPGFAGSIIESLMLEHDTLQPFFKKASENRELFADRPILNNAYARVNKLIFDELNKAPNTPTSAGALIAIASHAIKIEAAKSPNFIKDLEAKTAPFGGAATPIFGLLSQFAYDMRDGEKQMLTIILNQFFASTAFPDPFIFIRKLFSIVGPRAKSVEAAVANQRRQTYGRDLAKYVWTKYSKEPEANFFKCCEIESIYKARANMQLVSDLTAAGQTTLAVGEAIQAITAIPSLFLPAAKIVKNAVGGVIFAFGSGTLRVKDIVQWLTAKGIYKTTIWCFEKFANKLSEEIKNVEKISSLLRIQEPAQYDKKMLCAYKNALADLWGEKEEKSFSYELWATLYSHYIQAALTYGEHYPQADARELKTAIDDYKCILYDLGLIADKEAPLTVKTVSATLPVLLHKDGKMAFLENNKIVVEATANPNVTTFARMVGLREGIMSQKPGATLYPSGVCEAIAKQQEKLSAIEKCSSGFRRAWHAVCEFFEKLNPFIANPAYQTVHKTNAELASKAVTAMAKNSEIDSVEVVATSGQSIGKHVRAPSLSAPVPQRKIQLNTSMEQRSPLRSENRGNTFQPSGGSVLSNPNPNLQKKDLVSYPGSALRHLVIGGPGSGSPTSPLIPEREVRGSKDSTPTKATIGEDSQTSFRNLGITQYMSHFI